MNEPDNTKKTGRNPDGTWKKGFCPNPGGRGKNPLKEFSLKEFESWSDEEKRDFLSKISPIDRWKMTEGNPKQDTEMSGELKIVKPIYGGISKHNGDQEDILTKEEN